MRERKLLGKFDIVIIAVLVLIFAAAALYVYLPNGDITAYIYCNGEVLEEINLTKNTEVREIKAAKCVIKLEGHEIYFLKSDCPDKICVNSGKLSKTGQFASCVPQKVTIILKGKGRDEIDALTY